MKPHLLGFCERAFSPYTSYLYSLERNITTVRAKCNIQDCVRAITANPYIVIDAYPIYMLRIYLDSVTIAGYTANLFWKV